jgi:hypothetical protein
VRTKKNRGLGEIKVREADRERKNLDRNEEMSKM